MRRGRGYRKDLPGAGVPRPEKPKGSPRRRTEAGSESGLKLLEQRSRDSTPDTRDHSPSGPPWRTAARGSRPAGRSGTRPFPETKRELHSVGSGITRMSSEFLKSVADIKSN